MFGDAGHGTVMALFALSLIIFERKLANSDVGGEVKRILFYFGPAVYLYGFASWLNF